MFLLVLGLNLLGMTRRGSPATGSTLRDPLNIVRQNSRTEIKHNLL